MTQLLARNKEQQKFLETFLESTACPPNSMNFYQLDGYLRALCCGPGLAQPSEWLPLVFNDEQPSYRTAEEAADFMTSVMDLYNFHVDQVLNNRCDLPMPALYSAELSERVNQEQWARGFLQGYIFWEEVWNDLLECTPLIQIDPELQIESLGDELDGVLYIISTVADVELAVSQNTDPDSLDDIFDCLPETLVLCGRIGKALYEYHLASSYLPANEALVEQFVRDSDKVGRNDPCPCGSGKKFKKCCLH